MPSSQQQSAVNNNDGVAAESHPDQQHDNIHSTGEQSSAAQVAVDFDVDAPVVSNHVDLLELEDAKTKQQEKEASLPSSSSIFESAKEQMLLGQHAAMSKTEPTTGSASLDTVPQHASVPGAVAVSPLTGRASARTSFLKTNANGNGDITDNEADTTIRVGIAVPCNIPGAQRSPMSEHEEDEANRPENIDTTGVDLDESKHDSDNTEVQLQLDKKDNGDDSNNSQGDLAEARVVHDFVGLPVAYWYDPNRPSLYKNRRCQVYGVAGLVILLGIVAVSVVVLVAHSVRQNMDPNDATVHNGPTVAPTNYREHLIESTVVDALGADQRNLKDTVHQQTLNWITYDDPLQLEPRANNLIQRYVMAYFYFATSEFGPWLSCNPPTVNQTKYCYFKSWKCCKVEPPYEYRDVLWKRWLSEEHECNWAGITCYSERVTEIALDAHNLTGTLPYAAVSYLPFLRYLLLPRNFLRGSLPAQLAPLKHLTRFDLHRNELTGSIPVEWLEAHRNLIQLHLGKQSYGNGLTGTVPSEIGLLSDLQRLFLFENQLTSTLPTELYGMTKLLILSLSKNQLQGSLSSEIGNLKKLTYMEWGDNLFTGSIPPTLGSLSGMETLALYHTKMEGTIPDELFALTQMASLDLHDSNFSGTLSTMFGVLSALREVQLAGNHFSGTVPSELGRLSNLLSVAINDNPALTGSVPPEVCTQVHRFKVPANGNAQFVADCTENSPISCACCTACCSLESGLCVPTGYDV